MRSSGFRVWSGSMAISIALVAAAALLSGCGGSASSGYPSGRGWEMIDSDEHGLRQPDVHTHPDEWEIRTLNITATVRLKNERRYTDTELLGIAKRVVDYETRRPVTKVVVEFVHAKYDPNDFPGVWEVASVYWAPNGDLMQPSSDLGDYFRHRYRVGYNKTRD